MPAAIAAIHAARRARERGQRPPKPSPAVAAERKKQAERAAKAERALKEIFNRYDTNKTNKLDESQIRKLLTDLDTTTPPGTAPTDTEVEFILTVADQDGDNCLVLEELIHAIKSWKAYTDQRVLLTETIEKFDKSGSGRLDRPELKEYLKSLNEGNDITEEEVDWVMSETDIFGDGSISRPELLMATAAWYSYQEPPKKASSCVVS